MAQSLARILVHIVYSTKNRYPFLRPEVRPELNAYTATVARGCDCPAILVNCVADHLHVLCNFSRTTTVASLIEDMKVETSKWLKTKGGMLEKFHWQSGYGVFSVSASNAEIVSGYIAGQGEHHRKLSFQDEFRLLLRRHNVEFDERYVWD
jgi:REP element-mobilizing transposase RayT